MKRLFIISVLLTFIACESEEVMIPDNVIPPEKMVILIAEAGIIEAAAQRRLLPGELVDNTAKLHFKALFESEGITEKKFSDSFNFYRDHPKLFAEIYEQALSELSRKQAELKR